MSRENIEIVRRYLEEAPDAPEQFAGWGDRFWEPDGDYYPPRKLPEARPSHGREEIVRYLTEYRAAWELGHRLRVKDARAIGDDRVLAHVHVRAAGRASGLAVEGDTYMRFWLRHGRFIRVEDHMTAKGALHALGLSGETLEAAGLRE
jgi:hypothetical protein